MNFDFTVAITPNTTNIDRELQYVKSALLYADKVTLISPVAYLYTQIASSGRTKIDEKTFLRFFEFLLPLCESKDPNTYKKGIDMINTFRPIVCSKRYKAIPMVNKIEIRRMIDDFCKEIDQVTIRMIGEDQTSELDKLLGSGRLELQKFEHNLADVDGCVSEYCKMLRSAVQLTYPLFDEGSNGLMTAAVNSNIVKLSESDKRKITHAGVSDNLIQRLPSFEYATVDEILDIRRELTPSLARYRAKMLDYTENIQSLPWDQDFEYDCSVLYYKEVAPAIDEIDALTKETAFLKNLGYKVFSSDEFLSSAGGLLCSVAASGVISAFSNSLSADTSLLVGGGAWAAAKVATAYKEYRNDRKEIEKKDLYFYYKAGKLLEK